MTLLPPNSTKLERNLESALQRTTDLDAPLRDLWNPETCPEHILPWLAWGLGLTDWKTYWPASIKRAFIRDAVDFKRKQGTAKSVRQVVRNFGAAVVLQEGWQTDPPRAPHTFSVVINATQMNGETITEEFQQDIIDSIKEAKPARSSFTVTSGLVASASVRVGAFSQAYIYRRLELHS